MQGFRFVAATSVALAVGLGLTGCITINPAPKPTASPTTAAAPAPTPTIDDSAARQSVFTLRGALQFYTTTSAQEDCDYVTLTNDELSHATPLEEYRGSYEKLQQLAALVTGLCTQPESVNAAVLARDVADRIMAEHPPF